MSPFDDLQITLARWLARTVAPYIGEYLPPHTPPRPSLIFLRKEPSTMALVFALKLDPTPEGVVKRSLTVTLNGAAQPSFDAVDAMELKFALTDVVSLTLVDSKANGVASAPSAPFSFTVSDLVPPATPASPSLVFLREEADPVADQPTEATTPA